MKRIIALERERPARTIMLGSILTRRDVLVLLLLISAGLPIRAEDTTNTRQGISSDLSGAITLPASNALTHGSQMHYESSPLKNCLGYWFNVEDWAEWEFEVVRPGLFAVEVWQGCGQSQGGSEVAVEVDKERFSFVVEET